VILFGVDISEIVPDLTQFLLLGGLAVMVLSMAKAGFGGSVGLLSVPLMIYAVGGQKASLATGLMLPILIATDYMNMLAWWRRWRWSIVWPLLPGAVIGVVIAWVALAQMGFGGEVVGEQAQADRAMANAVMKLSIGAICLVFVGIRSIQALRAKPLAFRPVLWQSSIAGMVAGGTSTVAHAAGPVTAMYFLPQQLGKEAYVATTVMYYWIGNQIKLAPYLHLGLINRSSLVVGLLLVPAVPVGVVLGRYLAGKVSERVFSSIVYVLLALTGVDMCVKSLMYLL